MRKSLALAVPLLSVVTAIAACADKKPPVTPATTTGDAGAADAAVAVVTPVTPDAGAVATGPTFFTGDAGATATNTPPVLTEQALDAAIDLAITTTSPKAAPKMEKEGATSRATLKEGEHFGMVVTLQPGRCYTFMAFSPPGSVAQLDLKLLAMPLNIEAGKSSPSDKAAPVMGKGTGAICPVLPVAVPYKVDVAATKGAGRIGVQVFSRNK